MRLIITSLLLGACLGGKVQDADGDGFGVEADCDDSSSEINPGEKEACDGYDNNCDGVTDEGDDLAAYGDEDGDGFGDKETHYDNCEDAVEAGAAGNRADCDDTDENVHPGALEACDGQDNDCNGDVDSDCADDSGGGGSGGGSGGSGGTEESEGDDAGECEDGADNDRDGKFDCDDPDCQGASACSEQEINGDVNGFVEIRSGEGGGGSCTGTFRLSWSPTTGEATGTSSCFKSGETITGTMSGTSFEGYWLVSVDGYEISMRMTGGISGSTFAASGEAIDFAAGIGECSFTAPAD